MSQRKEMGSLKAELLQIDNNRKAENNFMIQGQVHQRFNQKASSYYY